MSEETERTVEFLYEDSPLHRTVYVDGVAGGTSARNVLYATFFDEKNKVASREVHKVVGLEGNRGRVGELIETDAFPSQGSFKVIRERQVTIVLSRKGLADLIHWLEARLEELNYSERQELSQSQESENA